MQVSTAPGFKRHLRAYLEGLEPAFFVTCLAAFLGDNGFALEFEPSTRKSRRADVAAAMGDARAFFECKTPESQLSDFARKHQEIFEALHPYLDTPHTVELRFRKSLSARELRELGEVIQRRLPNVRKDGVFFTMEGVEVSLDTTMDPAHPSLTVYLTLIGPDSEDKTVFPGMMIMRHGRKMTIYGPQVDASDLLKGQLHKAAKQAPADAPFVVTISAGTLLGAPREHRLAILEEFQPKKNTRVSGVLIADFPITFTGEEKPSLRFFPNPYASHPLSPALRELFGSA